MSDSKIEIKVGIVEFSGEGNQEWLATQLDKILNKVPELLKIELASPQHSGAGSGNGGNGGGKPKSNLGTTNLSVFLKEKNATTNHIKKFLATAAFIQLNGKNRMSTSDVTKALKDANQSKLNNASECLNQNVKKGLCEKDGGKEFFVTSHGLSDLGMQE